jgi:hypothetical protein
VNHSFGIVIEALVAVLLVVTIGYCMLLNKRLLRLKADEQSLKATIGELITATEIAERAIGGLKHTVRDVNENLGEQIAAATDLSERLIRQLAEGDAVLGRLSRIAVAARTPATPVPASIPVQQAPETPRVSAAKAAMAATQAFAERRRANGIAA